MERQNAEQLLDAASDFVDTTRRLAATQLATLQKIEHIWPERYAATSAHLSRVMGENAELLSLVLCDISQSTNGGLKVRAPYTDKVAAVTGVGLETRTGEYHLYVYESTHPNQPPTTWPLTSGDQLILE